jgi:uncharacterized repeat protein (TIGR03803 family)
MFFRDRSSSLLTLVASGVIGAAASTLSLLSKQRILIATAALRTLPARIASAFLSALILVPIALLLAPAARAQYTESVLFTFGGSDGGVPDAGLIFDSHGNLYGTTNEGGTSPDCMAGSVMTPNDCGTVFELSPPSGGSGPWTETVLYSFCTVGGSSCFDGKYPAAGVIFDSKGNLYGTTYFGGANSYGTVFELSPPTGGGSGPWSETVLYSFCSVGSCADGYLPTDSLIFDSKGNLYGTTYFGGVNGETDGAVFELSPPSGGSGAWTESVIYSFCSTNSGGSSCTDGDDPAAGLIFDSKGNLYGTTQYGGTAGGYGTVFELSPPAKAGGAWTESVLYSFACSSGGTSCPNGANPYAGVVFDSHGNLYGTTPFGGTGGGYGTVFELSPPSGGSGAWTASLLYSFSAGSDGANPYADLILDSQGNLYSTTKYGSSSGDGTAFELSPPSGGSGPWTETVLHSFCSTGGTSCTDGENPYASLIFDSHGNLYGTTQFGGTSTACDVGAAPSNCGVVFELQPQSVTGPTVTVSPTSLKWGDIVLDETAPKKAVTLTNTGTSTLNIGSIATSGDFAQTTSTTPCGSTLAAGKKCTIEVTFTPTQLGARTGTLTITDNASTSPQAVALSGTGEVQATLTPATKTFPAETVGTSSAAQVFTLANKQSVALTSIVISTTGDFSVSTKTCTASLAAKATCTISVVFTPTITGARTGTLKVSDNAIGSPQTSSLTGTGDAPATLTPASKTFPSEKVGTSTPAQVFTLDNKQSVALTGIVISTTGDFSVSTTTCTASLAAKATCTIKVVFTPTAKGTRTGTLKVTNNAFGSPETSSLTGTGT